MMDVWKVLKHLEAESEYDALDAREAAAVDNAVAKLEAAGPALPFPHSSNVNGADNLRELRPRSGRSRTRALYRQIGKAFVIGAIGPEAKVRPKDWKKAIRDAERRLDEIEE